MSEMDPIDEFMLLSTHLERSLPKRKETAWWYAWLHHLFRQPAREDYRWQQSQKTMGTWLEAGIYISRGLRILSQRLTADLRSSSGSLRRCRRMAGASRRRTRINSTVFCRFRASFWELS